MNSSQAETKARTLLRQAHVEEYARIKAEIAGDVRFVENIPHDPTITTMLYSVSEAAEAVGVSEDTLRTWRKKSYLVPTFQSRTGGGLYTLNDIDRAKQLVGTLQPGRKRTSAIGWKEVQRRAERELKRRYPEEYNEYYDLCRGPRRAYNRKAS